MSVRGSAILLPLLFSLPTLMAAQSRDLDAAISAGGRRTITPAPPAERLQWKEMEVTGVRVVDPRALCFRGAELAIADAALRSIVVVGPQPGEARALGTVGAAVGMFASLEHLSCGPGRTAFLAADLAQHRVTLFDSLGGVLGTARTPDVPQIDILGEYALAEDGSWFESWLGSRVPFGPYLTDAEWAGVPLARRYSAGGKVERAYGRTLPFENTVARRVLHRTFLRFAHDTLWILTQGDARLRAFRTDDGLQVAEHLLPIHERGRAPKVSVGRGHPRSPFRPATMEYDPTVGGFDLGPDSTFVVLGYRDWGWRRVGAGKDLSINRRAASVVTVVTRSGRVTSVFHAPGMVLSVAASTSGELAVVSEGSDGRRRVFLARLPPAAIRAPRP